MKRFPAKRLLEGLQIVGFGLIVAGLWRIWPVSALFGAGLVLILIGHVKS